MKILLAVVSATALLTGCATNPFAKHYQSYTNQMPLALQHRLLQPVPEPQIISVSAQTHRDEARRVEERGYVCIGFSGFVGGTPAHKQLIEQAKNVGADIVIHSSEYSHTAQGVRPVYSYEPGQTYTTTHYGTANANVYGSGGYAYGSGAYFRLFDNHDSLEQLALTTFRTKCGFMNTARLIGGHARPGIFGARFMPIPDEMRSILQRNTGALVEVVTQGSPAFLANIMRGDVIIQIADKPVATVEELINALPAYAGQKVSVRVIRGGQTRDIEIQLGQSL